MTHEQQDDGQALPSSIRSAISMLKGRKANDNPSDTSVPDDVLAPHLVLPVTPAPLQDEDLFPISARFPESQAHKQISQLTAENKSLTYALAASNTTIESLELKLAEAQETIARLSLERTEGVEDIIDRLRQFQVTGSNLGRAGSALSALNGIFSINTKLAERANLSSFNVKVEADLRIALETLQVASGNSFSFNIETVERGDFYKKSSNSSDPAKIDSTSPAKLMLVDLMKVGNSVSNTKDVKVVVLTVKDKIHFLKEEDFNDQGSKKLSFLNSTGSWRDGGIFRVSGQKIEHEGQGQSQNLTGPFDTVPVFIDELIGSCLTQVVGSTGFDQTARSLKAMGLMP